MEKHAIFPLNIFLLPGETTYLHIFEPRYKQLVKEVESTGMPFGIYFKQKENRLNLGTMVELKEVIKRYPGGEADISVKAKRIFKLEWFYDRLEDKLYPGGDITYQKVSDTPVSEPLLKAYSDLISSVQPQKVVELPSTVAGIASTLNMSSNEKLTFVQKNEQSSKERYVLSFIRLQQAIVEQEKSNNFNFHLN